MTYETAAARIGSMLDTALVPNPTVGAQNERLNVMALIDDGGRPRRDLSSGEQALVAIALDVHRGTGMIADLARLDRKRALAVCKILTELVKETAR